jgi:sterol desaturase/sphingolipid hydroxylase (fatty acid hydroxylase superfamily)
VLETLIASWQPVALVAGLAVFSTWETVAPFFPHPGGRARLRHGVRNLTVAALNGLVIVVVFAAATVFVADRTAAHRWGVLNQVPLSPMAHGLLAILVFDVWTYWWHRMNHRIPFLWRFHRMHHSDPEMDVTTGTRFHFGEIAMSSTIRLALIPAIGIPLVPMLIYDAILTASVQFHHSNTALPRRADRWLRYLLVSPFMHKVHHSRWRPETDSNYSSLLSVWDRLFGSYQEKEDYREIRLGLDEFDSDEHQTIRGLLVTPLANASRTVPRAPAHRPPSRSHA